MIREAFCIVRDAIAIMFFASVLLILCALYTGVIQP